MKVELNIKIEEDFGVVNAEQWEKVLKLCETIALEWKKVIGEEMKCHLVLKGNGKKGE